MSDEYLLISESALDTLLIADAFDAETVLPTKHRAVFSFDLGDNVQGLRVSTEPKASYFALINTEWLRYLAGDGGTPNEIYRRIARVIKGLRSPPIHLPRKWMEYHFKNMLAFFALPRETSNLRWVVDIDGSVNAAKFDKLSSSEEEVELTSFVPTKWPEQFEQKISNLLQRTIKIDESEDVEKLADEFDLEGIGSGSITDHRTFEQWENSLSSSQQKILANPIGRSIRIVGPAGSGKSLVLAMRALQIARDKNVIAQGKRIVVATHSWAMAERLDGVLMSLNGGLYPDGIDVLPLMALLEMHAGQIGNKKTKIIGDDSSDGRVRALEMIGDILEGRDKHATTGLSDWIRTALAAENDAKTRLDLVLDLYDEISGVLTASGISPDNQEAIQKYLSDSREDWMPPFDTLKDRGFVIDVYRRFISELVDIGAITTDQFVLDAIRVLETFTWRMRKETEGYDFIFVDELQLFDPQERTALELLGRATRGVPFITAEDPAQGVFSSLNARSNDPDNAPQYLDVVHRFNSKIFEFISFIYHQFPLNAMPLRIQDSESEGELSPSLSVVQTSEEALECAKSAVQRISGLKNTDERICIATFGDIDLKVADLVEGLGHKVVRLESFDDVEQLAYSKRAVVVAPWQFIGGTQFSHVLVLAVGLSEPASQFARLRELVAVYLACSRAADSLQVICAGHVPAVLSNAMEEKLLVLEHC